MKKAFCISIIVILLISLATIELIFVNKITHYLENEVANLPEKFISNKDNITVLTDDIKAISDYWNTYEDQLCLIFSHKDLSLTTDSLTKLLSYTINNDYNNAIVELTLLKELSSKNYHIMGFNIHNVF